MAVFDAVSYLRKLIHAQLNIRVPEAVPNPRPDEFVIVRHNGGSRDNALVDAPGIDIECWAQTMARARELSDSVSDMMLDLDRRGFKDGIASVEEEARRYDPDSESGQPRYYASYTLRTYKQ